jgi:hypothetical protein
MPETIGAAEAKAAADAVVDQLRTNLELLNKQVSNTSSDNGLFAGWISYLKCQDLVQPRDCI